MHRAEQPPRLLLTLSPDAFSRLTLASDVEPRSRDRVIDRTALDIQHTRYGRSLVTVRDVGPESDQ